MLLKPRERDAAGTALILKLDTGFGSQKEIDPVLTNSGEIVEVLLEEASGHLQVTESTRPWLGLTHDVHRFACVNDGKGHLDPPRLLLGPRFVGRVALRRYDVAALNALRAEPTKRF